MTNKKITIIIAASAALYALTASAATAQLKLHVTGKPVTDIKNDVSDASGNRARTSQDPESLIISHAKQLGARLINDMKTAHDLAAFQNAAGQQADPAGAQCYAALLPVIALVVNGPQTAAPSTTTAPAEPPAPVTAQQNSETKEDGAVTRLEKLRIIRLALQSTNLKNSCAALVQDVQSQISTVITGAAGIARIVTGLGLGLP